MERDQALDRVLGLTRACEDDPVAIEDIIAEACSRLGLDMGTTKERLEKLANEAAASRTLSRLADTLADAAGACDVLTATAAIESAGRKVSALYTRIPKPINMDLMRERLASTPDGLPYPWPTLSSLVRLDPGTVTVIAAATSAGKTTLALNIILDLLDSTEKTIIHWTGEMAAHLLIGRMVGIKAGVEYTDVRRAYNVSLYPAEVLDADKWLVSVSDRLIIIDGDMTAAELASIAQIYASRGRELVMLVDYLQQLSAEPTSAHWTREEELSQTCVTLRKMAVELGIPVVECCQLNRTNDGGHPELRQLRESGKVEQEATAVIGIRNSQLAHVAGSGLPAAPTDGTYDIGDEDSTKAAVTMAERYCNVLLELSISKNRLRGHVGKVVPLMMSTSGQILQLPRVAGAVKTEGKTAAATTAIPMKGRR
jgi:hypothetical protein